MDRQPNAIASASIWTAIESGRATGFLAAHAITTIHYLIRKEQGHAKAKRLVGALLQVFDVAAIDRSVIERALELPGNDFEDAVTAASAAASNCDLIITRDPKGFRGSPVLAVTPEMALPILKTQDPPRPS